MPGPLRVGWNDVIYSGWVDHPKPQAYSWTDVSRTEQIVQRRAWMISLHVVRRSLDSAATKRVLIE